MLVACIYPWPIFSLYSLLKYDLADEDFLGHTFKNQSLISLSLSFLPTRLFFLALSTTWHNGCVSVTSLFLLECTFDRSCQGRSSLLTNNC